MENSRTNILVSACLLGVCCRYNGESGWKEEVAELKEKYGLIPICPEQLGGMGTPREPSEIRSQAELCVENKQGEDVTDYYVKGAEETLKLARIFGCRYAVLKERSPSCGHGIIYDGTFSGTRIRGDGVTAALLEKNGISVFGESEAGQLMDLSAN